MLVNRPIDLTGTWQFQLGPSAAENTMTPPASPLEPPATFNDTIRLPGTTDTNHKGIKTTGSVQGTYTRRYRHIGRAWYHRTILIPKDWQDRDIELFIERALWKTTVYLDGQRHSDCDSLATPHIYNLGPIVPGTHTLMICVDNSMIYNIGDKSHSYSENMQTIWNGMLGKLELRALQAVQIQAVRSRFSSTDSKTGQWVLMLNNTTGKPTTCSISFDLTAAAEEKRTSIIEVLLQPGLQKIVCPLLENLTRWDEFKPHLYDAQITVQAGQEKTQWQGKLGFCQPGSDGMHITINGRPTFLRGNLDNCHFPLTGHPPMDKAGWLCVWNIYKQFGYNHVRFHSWCPPEAAFAAADKVGIYIQAEAGVWIDGWMKGRVASKPEGISDKNPAVRDFVSREMKRIIDAYGHHPSFIMFCTGNELGSSNFETLSDLITQTRQYDDTSRLYSCSTARRLQPEVDDFFVSHQNPAGSMRGLRGAKTDWTYDNVKRGAPKTPLILHELGQWPIWPAWDEIDKYTGVVEARNLQGFKELARKNHILSQDAEFQAATGKFSVLLYKAEMEGALRSKTYSGFHSLGLQDYIGQGEAMIGVLDMFYDLKPGTITPKQYRQFCCPVVPLAQFTKYTWTSGETFTALLQISNFSDGPIDRSIVWKLIAQNGKTLDQGIFEKILPQGTVTDLGRISLQLNTDIPLACTLELAVKDTLYKNTWPIWIYPALLKIDTPETVLVAEGLDDETLEALNAGKSVLLMAADCMTAANTHRNTFMPVYWSVSFFPGQKKTLGLTCDPNHALFKLFPNNGHCDWQWYDIVKDSSAMILNDLPADYRPLVQPVDDFHLARKLGTIFESKVGKGKLLACVYPLRKRLNSPACRQMYAALLEYAAGNDFKPETELPIDWLKKNLTPQTQAKVSDQSPIGQMK
ncbi:MAG: glycoside hydrolase family 2 [Planctomycetes bacterium]|nr:glycoside hydrolase family 2 [Planctomycetota bacterium]